MNKFVKLYESSIQRYTRGGFLTGDLVKFTENAFRDDFFKKQAPNYIQKAKSFNDSGLNLRVSAIKAVRPTIHSGDIQNEAESFLIDIVQEVAPGLYREFITVPAHLLEPIHTYPNLAPVPDGLKRKGDININPKLEDVAAAAESILSPNRQTMTSDLGNQKDDKGDRKLNNVNVQIPSSPAQGERTPDVNPNFPNPGKSTARYLPKRKFHLAPEADNKS
jgi:hypothetical protein